jgi:hypothetical protein
MPRVEYLKHFAHDANGVYVGTEARREVGRRRHWSLSLVSSGIRLQGSGWRGENKVVFLWLRINTAIDVEVKLGTRRVKAFDR